MLVSICCIFVIYLKNASDTQGWKLDEITGTLTAFQLERKDEGEYTCIAENNAGRVESAAYLKAEMKTGFFAKEIDVKRTRAGYHS